MVDPDLEAIAKQIVDSAIKVHTALGPGLLESAYQACLAYKLRKRSLRVDCEIPLPVVYEGFSVDAGYRCKITRVQTWFYLELECGSD